MKAFQEKLDTLTKKVEDKKRIDDASDVDKAKRVVKEEAGRAEVNVDILHEKLLHLESVARRTGHESVVKLNLILKRFHVHKKQNPAFVGNMVLAQISSKDEEAVLNKEQKCYKQYNMVYPWGSSNNALSWGYGNIQNQMPGPFGPSSVGHLPSDATSLPYATGLHDTPTNATNAGAALYRSAANKASAPVTSATLHASVANATIAAKV